MAGPVLIKKYSNRRLYDTSESRYVTQDELADTIRRGADVQVVDAKTGEDLTQSTLVQVILESPAARLLPVPLLTRLVRLHDDALAEFLGRWVSGSLDLYLSARQGLAQGPLPALGQMPSAVQQGLAQLQQLQQQVQGEVQRQLQAQQAQAQQQLQQLAGLLPFAPPGFGLFGARPPTSPWEGPSVAAPPPGPPPAPAHPAPPAVPPASPDATRADVDSLRAELAELKGLLRAQAPGAAPPSAPREGRKAPKRAR